MRLHDLYEASDKMVVELRQQVIDYLIPMVAHKIDFVTVSEIEAMLRNSRTGLSVDRSLVMQILDPTKIKVVKRVDGERVYLSITAAMTDDGASTEEEEQKAQDKLSDKATKQAKKSIKEK